MTQDNLDEFTSEMNDLFIKTLKKSKFFKGIIKELKKTKIKEIDQCMGVYLITIDGEAKEFTDNALEETWDLTGVDIDNDEEPTKLIYQKELDVFRKLETVWDNNVMFDRTFFHEFKETINEALAK